MAKIIGRKQESKLLMSYLNNDSPEFVVVYGRRRVGKTYLIRSLLSEHFSFYVTGLSPIEKKENKTSDLQYQLQNFSYALNEYGYEGEAPTSWMEAFHILKELLSKLDKTKKHVVFIDEMPWMDTPRSGFLVAFEAFWNGWASGQDNLMLVVCGSATSWIIKKIFKNKGGLFNRVTRKIYLPPFTLSECEKLAEMHNLSLSRYDMLSAYMVLGGVPFYWNQLQPGMSLAQNIDALFFASKNAPLRDEFELLMRSLFNSPEPYIKIIQALNSKNGGLTRDEISNEAGMTSGGGLSQLLEDLDKCNFITEYHPIKSNGAAVYRLTDFFTLFYMRFVANKKINDPAFWSHYVNSHGNNTWNGLSFELVCHLHLEQIKKALQIGGVLCNHQALRTKGAQIDLLLNRGDHVTNLCEAKFYSLPFSIKSDYQKDLLNKLAEVKEVIPAKNSLHLTIISTYGLKINKYSSIVQSQVTMEDLFDN